MGLSFRKSVKLFGNTRLNFSKTGGIGISTGVKGARVSMNRQGIRTTVGKGGLQYRKQFGYKNINCANTKTEKLENLSKLSRLQLGKVIIVKILKTVYLPINFVLIKILDMINIILRRLNKNNKMLNNHTQEEVEVFKKEHYITHIKLIFGGLGCIVIGFILPPVLLVGMVLVVAGLVCMIKNWKRINMEYKTRISK